MSLITTTTTTTTDDDDIDDDIGIVAIHDSPCNESLFYRHQFNDDDDYSSSCSTVTNIIAIKDTFIVPRRKKCF